MKRVDVDVAKADHDAVVTDVDHAKAGDDATDVDHAKAGDDATDVDHAGKADDDEAVTDVDHAKTDHDEDTGAAKSGDDEAVTDVDVGKGKAPRPAAAPAATCSHPRDFASMSGHLESLIANLSVRPGAVLSPGETVTFLYTDDTPMAYSASGLASPTVIVGRGRLAVVTSATSGQTANYADGNGGSESNRCQTLVSFRVPSTTASGTRFLKLAVFDSDHDRDVLTFAVTSSAAVVTSSRPATKPKAATKPAAVTAASVSAPATPAVSGPVTSPASGVAPLGAASDLGPFAPPNSGIPLPALAELAAGALLLVAGGGVLLLGWRRRRSPA